MVERGEADDAIDRAVGERDAGDGPLDAHGADRAGADEIVGRVDPDVAQAGRQMRGEIAAARRHVAQQPARESVQRLEHRAELGVARMRARRHCLVVGGAALGENLGVAVEHQSASSWTLARWGTSGGRPSNSRNAACAGSRHLVR